MSIAKYVGEQGGDHGPGSLFWGSASGPDGFPLRAQAPPLIKQDEIDTEVEIQQDFHAEDFDLSDEAACRRYHEVMDRVVNGWYVCYARDRFRDPSTGKIRIYVEWAQRYGAVSPRIAAMSPRSGVRRVDTGRPG